MNGGVKERLGGVLSRRRISSPLDPPPAGCPATGTQAHDLSCELPFKVQLRSALPQWPPSPSSRFAESQKRVDARYRGQDFRCAEVPNLFQDLTCNLQPR